MPGDPTTTILFYVNAALVFCVITELITLIFLAKKTAYIVVACQTAAIVHAIGSVAFLVQLVMYACGNNYAIYAVYAALGIMIAAFLTTAVYCFMISRRSNRMLCILTGIFNVVQPVGTAFMIVLLTHIRPDNRAEEFVFTGYTYTYAALESFVEKFELGYIDGATEENFKSLDKKELRAHLKELRSKAVDPEGQFRYGEALAHYCPKRTSLAIQYITMAARFDYPPALFNLGYIYEMGILGFKQDVKKAYENYNRASSLGDGDAALRLGIADIKRGKAADGYGVFRSLAAKGDKCAMYNAATCLERGVGVEKNLSEAIDGYKQCKEIFTAQKRLFALAAPCVTESDEGKKAKTHAPDAEKIFESIVSCEYDGDFKVMIDGLKEVKNGQAKTAADIFLSAVKLRGKWEGVARCLVGALYLDCGALPIDRANGAAYVKSAMNQTPIAHDVYFTIPKSVISPKRSNAHKNVHKSEQ